MQIESPVERGAFSSGTAAIRYVLRAMRSLIMPEEIAVPCIFYMGI